MHTDRKVGFAMGILLIGVVAALFFRNEPLLKPNAPSVRREQELNQRLRERDVAVYLEEKKPVADADPAEPVWSLRDVLKNMDARNKAMPSPVVTKEETRIRLPFQEKSMDGFRTWREEPEEAEGRKDDVDGSGRSPSGDEVNDRDAAQRPLPPLMPETEKPAPPSNTVPSTAPVEGAPFSPPAEFDEYVVRYGDTLSGIAEKLLGSQSKYLLIFEANRDRMTSPDRLDVGKPLRIPRIAGSTGTRL